MADRDEPQPDGADARPENIRQRLEGVASGIDIGELEQARSNDHEVGTPPVNDWFGEIGLLDERPVRRR